MWHRFTSPHSEEQVNHFGMDVADSFCGLKGPIDDGNNHRLDQERWRCKGTFLGRGIQMDVFGASKRSRYVQEPFLVLMEHISQTPFVKIWNIMCSNRTLLQTKLRASKCAAAIGLPGGLWEMEYMGMPSFIFWQQSNMNSDKIAPFFSIRLIDSCLNLMQHIGIFPDS